MSNTDDYSGFAFISLGANLPSAIGNPGQTIAWAFGELATLSAGTLLKSSLYITAPVDSPEGTPDFYNAMAGITPLPDETPLSLLHKMQVIENQAGRTRSGIRNEARSLDLDLITFRQETMQTDELTLPHPRAHERRFVMEPLAEIAGTAFSLPGHTGSLQQVLKQLSSQQKIRKTKV